MRFHEVITKRIEQESGGLSLAGVLSAAVTANVNERGTAETSVRTHQRIVQSGGADRKRDPRRRQP
jgi:hypothetical protein